MDRKKIIITGYGHSGTSILQSIISHIKEVYTMYPEMDKIDQSKLKNIKEEHKFILIKQPRAVKKYFSEPYYDNFIKIIIMRNPAFVLSSIIKRHSGNLDFDKYLNNYIGCLEIFNDYLENPKEDIFTIRYEDIFDSNYKKLKDIFDTLNFNYEEDIFDNTKFTNTIGFEKSFLEEREPKRKDHAKFRTWQINREFKNMNNVNNICLNSLQKNKILEIKLIKKIFPEIEDLLKD